MTWWLFKENNWTCFFVWTPFSCIKPGMNHPPRVGTLPETNIAREHRPFQKEREHHFLQGRKEVEGLVARCAVITRFRRCVFFGKLVGLEKKTVLSNFRHLFRNMKIGRLSVAFSPHFFAYISFDDIFLVPDFCSAVWSARCHFWCRCSPSP